MSFYYNIDETPWELNSYIYQLAYGKIGSLYIVLFEVTVPKNLLTKLSEDLLYYHFAMLA